MEFPNTLSPDFFETWKKSEKLPAGSLLHDPMKEYVGNMKKYVGNTKKYVKNMKEYVENMRKYVENVGSMKEYIGNMKKNVENMKEYEEICRYNYWISHRPYRLWDLEKFGRALPSYSLWDLEKFRSIPFYEGAGP